MPESTNSEVRQLLTNELANNLSRAIEGMTGESPKLAIRDGELKPEADWITWRQKFNVSPDAAWLSARGRTWTSIGTKTLQAAGIDDSDPTMANSTFAEILGQAFSMLARSLTGRTGQEWTCGEGVESADGPGAVKWKAIDLTFASGESETVLLGFDDPLLEAIEGGAPKPAPTPAIQPSMTAMASTTPAAPRSRTLDLLLDVELPVSVSFGRAQLPLKDVIKLTTGSIVELNRTISEPVEVIVNNCVIARGEVVVVEGNFGVRIQQVISREERLRTLF